MVAAEDRAKPSGTDANICSLALHHINGDPADNRLENLQLLCPNCHSQTATFAGRNARRGTAAPEQPAA